MHQTHRIAYRVGLVAALFASTATMALAAADPSASKEKERQSIAVLKSDSPKAEKAMACKRLAVYGSKDAIPLLAPLLADEQLASWSRIALEAIPGPEADEALRDAMPKLNGKLLIGVINSIGVRRDAAAVDGLSAQLKNADAQVASAAAVALGHIGNPAACKVLRESLAAAPAGVRSGIAEGCILCAERLLAEDKAAEAAAVYDEVRQAEVPKPRILEATRGAILARKSAGIPLLIEQLRSKDKALLYIGLCAARELPGSDVANALAAEAVSTSPDRAALILQALADRGDTVASPAVLQAAKSGPKPARLAAIGILRRAGNASSVPTLLEISIDADPEIAQSGRAALAVLPGNEVDAEIVARLSKAENNLLPLLIELVGQRRIDATAALQQAVDSTDPQIRHAALTALGATVGPDGLPILIARATAPKNADDGPVARQALRTASIRMADREACAKLLVAAMNQGGSDVAKKVEMLEILGAVGGTNALAALGAAGKDADAQLQDTSTRLLGAWMTVDAAPVLLDLAKTAPDDKYKARAMRGCLRLVRQFSVPEPQRAEICRAALEITPRESEQKLVLEVLQRHPSREALGVAVKAMQIPAIAADANRTALVIVQKIGGQPADVKKLLAQAGLKPVKIEIVKAEYGAGARQKDVTEILRKAAGDLPLLALPSPSYNASFGGDPAPGSSKQLKIKYQLDGQPGEATFAENAMIVLPLPK
ncbi:MAG: PBS lyase [Planctomycetia bacterium]|nr:PBS lyase [Planctomycetia bacterium]